MLVLQWFDSAKFRWQFNYLGRLYSKEAHLQKNIYLFNHSKFM